MPRLRVLVRVIALARMPLDLVRGMGGAEKVLKNAKDACAAEVLEIATCLGVCAR